MLEREQELLEREQELLELEPGRVQGPGLPGRRNTADRRCPAGYYEDH